MDPKLFLKAVRGTEIERKKYVEQFNSKKPNYLTGVFYADDFSKLKEKFGIVPIHGSVAKTYPLNLEQITTGSNSEIYICPKFFDNVSSQTTKQLERVALIADNLILNHEFEHATQYNRGIYNYPYDKFKSQDENKINFLLFGAVSELCAYNNEINGIKKIKKLTYPEQQFYINGIIKESMIYYAWLFDERITNQINPEFLKELKEKLNPQKFH